MIGIKKKWTEQDVGAMVAHLTSERGEGHLNELHDARGIWYNARLTVAQIIEGVPGFPASLVGVGYHEELVSDVLAELARRANPELFASYDAESGEG